MKFLTTRLQKKIYSRLFYLRKKIYQLKSYDINHRKTILFMVGCQRSGTTLMQRIIDRDLNSKVYGEFSKLSSNDLQNKIRLNPLSSVKRIIDKNRASLVVLKPLVETQNLLKLLDFFPGSKALWIYRNYKDVASSDLKKFGLQNGINNLRPIIENKSDNWRVENIPEGVKKIVLNYFDKDMNPYDAAVLFWYVRNSFFFELGLDKNPNTIMCRYEDLVTKPLIHVEGIYKFIGHKFPGDKIISEVHSSSLKKGKEIILSLEIDHLCMELLERLDKVYTEKEKGAPAH